MSKRINIINFVRESDPRYDAKDALFYTVEKHIELEKKYNFKSTYLLQYDAMISPRYQALFAKEKTDKMEIGLWFEVVKQLCDKVGIAWQGREGYDWDWHANPTYLTAYTFEEKKKLIDEAMDYYFRLYGAYPKSVGCWIMDSQSMEYMQKEYGVVAFCLLREQYGTDGYTVWGGYYEGGYYPSIHNAFMPAQTEDLRLKAPVFRMLGVDLIYNYYEKFMNGQFDENGVPSWILTMEPVSIAGFNEKFVKTYFDSMLYNEDMGFSYVQLGQENSMGWANAEKGLNLQFEYLKEKEGQFVIETLSETGMWFKETYNSTPATARAVLSDWKNNNNQSVWYNCKNYRANVFSNGEKLYFRDIYLFEERIKDKHIETPCKEEVIAYQDSLPVIDGCFWSNEEKWAGIYIDGCTKIDKVYKDGDTFCVAVSGEKKVELRFSEDKIEICGDDEFAIRFVYDEALLEDKPKFLCDRIDYIKNGFEYSVSLNKGSAENKSIRSNDKEIVFSFVKQFEIKSCL